MQAWKRNFLLCILVNNCVSTQNKQNPCPALVEITSKVELKGILGNDSVPHWCPSRFIYTEVITDSFLNNKVDRAVMTKMLQPLVAVWFGGSLSKRVTFFNM